MNIIVVAGVLATGLYLGFGILLLWLLFSAYGERAPKSASFMEECMRWVKTIATVVVWPMAFLIFLPNLWSSLRGRRNVE